MARLHSSEARNFQMVTSSYRLELDNANEPLQASSDTCLQGLIFITKFVLAMVVTSIFGMLAFRV